MKIANLTIENFKKFKSKFEFNFYNQNFLVGENNTGKTSVIDAVNYLLKGPEKDKKYKNLNANSGDFIVIEAEISGDFSDIDAKYNDYIFKDSNGASCMKIRRSDETKEIIQSGKNIKLDESKILCWNETVKQFENPTGRDTTFNVIDVVSIYANDQVDDVVSFDSTKILGKLIKNSVGNFFETEAYKQFKLQHDTVFNTGPDSLKSRLNSLAEDISKILKEQWGELEIGFKFDLTDNSSHLKKGSVLIKEGGIEHELEGKGSGLQRSVMLSVIQALSKVYISDAESNIILCIDEPELNLHPRAQEKLSIAFNKLSENIQVIVSTHSPYMLKSFKKDLDTVYIFKDSQNANPEKLDKISVLPFGPTLTEIQYFAYNLTPVEFHNELYNEIETKFWDDQNNDFKALKMNGSYDQSDCRQIVFDNEFFNKIKKEPIDSNFKTTQNKVTKHTYIRNKIHHSAENGGLPTEKELKESIEKLIEFI